MNTLNPLNCKGDSLFSRWLPKSAMRLEIIGTVPLFGVPIPLGGDVWDSVGLKCLQRTHNSYIEWRAHHNEAVCQEHDANVYDGEVVIFSFSMRRYYFD